MSVTALIVAAGRGTRAGGDIAKQYQLLEGEPVVLHTLRALRAHPAVQAVVLVVHPADRPGPLSRLPLPPGTILVDGGASRAASVRAGLDAVPEGTSQVLIHDAARPLVSPEVIDRVLVALCNHAGAAPALPVTDALWRGSQGLVSGLQDRAGLWRAQTPQGFALDRIRAAHAGWSGPPAADDVEVARAHGLDVAIVEGDDDNLKITHPPDFARAAAILRRHRRDDQIMDIRTGTGYDVHAFAPGDHVMLCGIRVPHDRALKGHSDADVGMHAITDAIYGALAEGDIGRHFPPSDPQWKGAASAIFLRHAAELAGERGYAIANIDCTLICERPKIGPHAEAMRAELAEITGIEPARISVKATTSEQLGFTGREEGIAAMASCLLVAR
ncbi:bifunctional 2-C-methyl-D-erythritol 4-phosphate cytidylyltransferase/2-C-methyl-D-erythritol 2,4-cyclodiphosphate synthase [Mangrovicoccus algicola]|uniref:Bifunctional enzyme IspD/IspF n=1 Tax=Mangrovicoccus algicola TaxID=2771008 RepID=A0A8J6YVA9_9RHOB|nr:bifunctional 2-C-methyl-D-erythritol 4-phosphate cytidylyltransferase/2-C-methyl-D-erythritol 2,4-cyclodiphosphate synthase [Mangrovicoccus algicola]MBE3638470.1 bifunctional 2-C-methyl-D-erythritol 4-phosphate cytidylyltransferase/2-C-methyl-D-erythritol 2,4-cyclodiphosphate synthase [Mangrovicoccus algicola]